MIEKSNPPLNRDMVRRGAAKSPRIEAEPEIIRVVEVSLPIGAYCKVYSDETSDKRPVPGLDTQFILDNHTLVVGIAPAAFDLYLARAIKKERIAKLPWWKRMWP